MDYQNTNVYKPLHSNDIGIKVFYVPYILLIKEGRYRHPDLHRTICVVQLCNSLNFAPIKTFLETSFIQLLK